MAALVLDIDHRGVRNFVLCKEDLYLDALYKKKSVAEPKRTEKNSIDLAWATQIEDRTFYPSE
jgi:hypothetical protein